MVPPQNLQESPLPSHPSRKPFSVGMGLKQFEPLGTGLNLLELVRNGWNLPKLVRNS